LLVRLRRRCVPRSGEDGGGDDGGGDDGGGDDGGGDDPPPSRGGNVLTPLRRSETHFIRLGLWSHPFGSTLAMTFTENF